MSLARELTPLRCGSGIRKWSCSCPPEEDEPFLFLDFSPMGTPPLPDDAGASTAAPLRALPPPHTTPPPSADEVNDASASTPAEIERFRRRVAGLNAQVDKLEQRVNEVSEFYGGKKQGSNSKGSPAAGKEKERAVGNTAGSCNGSISGGAGGGKKPAADAGRREAACSKRMQDLMRQFGTILRQISQHKWAWPFMEPVDVEGLGLHDYYEVIKKPMDFGTIRNQMEATDGTGYKNVREIYADVRLVFTNAMTYNDDKDDVHVMAKTLLDKFEEKWLQLLPKVIEEETRQKEEEAMAQANMVVAREAVIAKMARDVNKELNELCVHLDELREAVVQKCRKMSTEEKRKLGVGLSSLSPEDINKALEIIAQSNPNFQAMSEEVNIDMDEQSETTLWRLKFFVKGALELQAKNSTCKTDENSKRKKEICDALAKTEKKRSKILSS